MRTKANNAHVFAWAAQRCGITSSALAGPKEPAAQQPCGGIGDQAD